MSRVRLHRSTLVIAALGLAIAVLLEVPGRIVGGQLGYDSHTDFEHGWPWTFLRRHTFARYDYGTIPPERMQRTAGFASSNAMGSMTSDELEPRYYGYRFGIPSLSAVNWQFWNSQPEDLPLRRPLRPFISWGTLLLDWIFVSALIASATLLWEIRRRHRPSLWSFNIADLFVAITGVSIALGGAMYFNNEWKKEQQSIDNIASSNRVYASQEHCIAPLWLRMLLGDYLLPGISWRTSSVDITWNEQESIDEIRHALISLPYLSTVSISSSDQSTFPFSALASFKRIRTIDLAEYPLFKEEDANELLHLGRPCKIIVSSIAYQDEDIMSQITNEMPGLVITTWDGE